MSKSAKIGVIFALRLFRQIDFEVNLVLERFVSFFGWEKIMDVLTSAIGKSW